MQPKFKNIQAWEQAQVLMQPTFIRVIDNLRKQVESSNWEGTYQELQQPYPGYQLTLKHKGMTRTVNLWSLCFQICFVAFSPDNHPELEGKQEVDIDTNLLNPAGEVDWSRLEEKTTAVIKHLFNNLPTD